MSLFFAAPSFADSPITSTNFHTAYLDLNIVQKAVDTKVMDTEIANYLFKENPIDVKAAAINAMGWSSNGDNADKYSNIVYGKSIEDIDIEKLSGEELFNLGYLLAMDDYFNVEEASYMLQKSKEKLDNSFTVSIVTAIVYSQRKSNWADVWAAADNVIKDEELQHDLRPEAAKTIIDYMSLYSIRPVINPFANTTVIKLQIGDPMVWVNHNEYELDFGRRTKPELTDGQIFIPISPLIRAMGGNIAWDRIQRKVTIEFNSREIELWIGKNTAVINGESKQIDVPYISNSRTMLTVDFLKDNLGLNANWDETKKEITMPLVIG